MKYAASLVLMASIVGCTLPAQVATYQSPASGGGPVVVRSLFNSDQLDLLLGPIALYPDALIALILPASTSASDVVLAARYLQLGGDPAQADAQPWDDSVRGLAHYPQVVRWMDENLQWTKQLGDVFSTQPDDVMQAVQRLRARAWSAGTLVNTAQQQVVFSGTTIMIVPSQPDLIYVPYYDPGIVYVGPRSYYPSDTYLSFSGGFATGLWLSFGLDWGNRRIWTVDRADRERYWREHRTDWHRPPAAPLDPRGPQIHPWQPHGEPRPNARRTPSRPAQVVPPTPHDRSPDPRGDGRHDRPTPGNVSPNPSIVGPQPTPVHRDNDRDNKGPRHSNSGSLPTGTHNQAPVVGPTAPVTGAPPANSPGRPAPEPRNAPPLHHGRPTPSPTPAPTPSQGQPSQPQSSPQGSSAPAQNAPANNDDDGRKPPFVRAR